MRYGTPFAPWFFVSPNNSDSLRLTRSKTSEIGIIAKVCFGNSISSADFDFPNLYNGPPEIFCKHNATVHLSLERHPSASRETACRLLCPRRTGDSLDREQSPGRPALIRAAQRGNHRLLLGISAMHRNIYRTRRIRRSAVLDEYTRKMLPLPV